MKQIALITSYNTKLEGINSFGISTKSCLYKTVECGGEHDERGYCYAEKGFYCYDSNKERFNINYEQSKKADFVDIIKAQLTLPYTLGMKYFRIHHIGSFYNQEYFDKWVEIVKCFPNTKFLVYVRNYDLDISDKSDNFLLIYSMDGSTLKTIEETPFERSATVDRTRLKKNVKHLSKYDENTLICASSKCVECLVCWNSNKNIVFPVTYKTELFDLEVLK